MSRIKAVIFDFDGTLADTSNGIVKTFVETFRQMAIPIPSESIIKSSIGLELFDGFMSLPGIESYEMAKMAVDIYRKVFNEIAVPIISLFEGIPDLLELLKSRGVTLAIATSRTHLTLEALASRMGIRQFFDGLYGAEDVKNHKPHPETALKALDDLGLKAEETLVIGDTTYDLLMGISAGCKVCGVTWGNQSREMLESVKPDFVVETVDELKLLLQKCL